MTQFQPCETCGFNLIVEHVCRRCGKLCCAYGYTPAEYRKKALALLDDPDPPLVKGGQGRSDGEVPESGHATLVVAFLGVTLIALALTLWAIQP